MEHLPFCVFRRNGRTFYYVKFKNSKGGYSGAVSTKRTIKAEAIAVAFEWLKEGKPINENTKLPLSITDAIKQVRHPDEADFICSELKRRGLIKEYIIAKSKEDVNFTAYLLNFWDYDSSPYVKEKLRKNHGIHKNYTTGQKLVIKKYWEPFFKERLLGGITRQDIENFIDFFSVRDISAIRKNMIIKAGIIPLRWAFSKEMIEKDITQGITWFSGKVKERYILTPEIAGKVFRVKMLERETALP